MGFRLKNWVGFLFLIPLFLLYSCGGGGDSSSPPPPTVTTTPATEITVLTASLNGTVNPNAQATTAVFEWGTDSALASPTTTTPQDIGAGTTDQPVNVTITGLTSGTTYYYRVAATNASGTQQGTIANFTTTLPNSPPAVTTHDATSVTISEAVLNATVIPNELDTTAHFEYGTDSTLVSPTLTPVQSIGAGTTSVAITATLSGLDPETTYYFRVVATNSAGTSEGVILSFNTFAQFPIVTTAAATSITTSSAILNGSVNPNGLAASVVHFEYEIDSALASPTLTNAEDIGAGTTSVAIFATLSGLDPGTTYYFRGVATNSTGTTEGDIVSFNSNLFFDDFSTDTTGSYTSVVDDFGGDPLLPPEFNYDVAGEQLEILTGDDFGLIFSPTLSLPATDNGVFSFDFFPSKTHPFGGGIWVRLMQDPSNYYEIAAFEWDVEPSPNVTSTVSKVVGTSEVESDAFAVANNYVSDPNPTKYHVTITFTPTMTTVDAFGETIVLDKDTTPINVSKFEIELGQQDAYIDNIELKLLDAP